MTLYSGSNFERPAFQNLFRELEQGTINCVLVKDLSRFGRNYIEVGRYLERIFPVMRVRLIAVTDNYDSQSAWKTSDSIMVPMRNLLNDAYCRDISVKIKSQLAVKRKRGDFVGSFAAYILEILHERERKALICFSALERQEEKLSEEKAEIVKQRVALYEQYADGNMSKEEFIRQRDAYRVQEDDKMEQIQRLRTEKNQIFQPVKKDTDNLQAVMNTVGEAGDVMHLSQNVVETFIDRIEVFNDECVKIRFTFEDVLKSYEAE